MKMKIFTLLFLLISAAVLQTNSQSVLSSAVNPEGQMITAVQSSEGRYLNSKVYLHIHVNGNTETKFVAVERSLDATNCEVIGFIKIYGTDVQSDLAYYFTDESPVAVNLYYKLSDYSNNNEPVYSETISVIPLNENLPDGKAGKTPDGIITTTAISSEQTLLVDGSTN